MPIKKHILRLLQAIFVHKIALLTGVLVLLAIFLPLQIAQASWWNPFTWADDIVKGLTVIIITLLTVLPAGIFFIVAGLVTWILQTVLSIGIVPGAIGVPQFVEVGWSLSRDFVNILLLLILVFIGLATILRLQTYQYQKTLPALLIVALLINFSGVFVGAIVDISNIITNFFLTALGQFGGDTFGNIFLIGLDFIDSLDDSQGLAQTFAMGVIYGLVMAIFYSISALIFFIIFLLFFVRTIMLWTLVILAPLAFGAYILPITRSLFSQWLKQLIQWSIVGIPISFFMYLSNLVMKLDSNVWNSTPGDSLAGGGIGFMGEIITSMMAPMTGLVLLFIGIQLSMRMAPAGAQGIINFSKKAAGFAALKGGMALGRKFAPGIQKFGEKMRQRGNETREIPENAGWLRKSFSTAMNQPSKIGRWGMRQAGTGITFTGDTVKGKVEAYDKKKTEAAKKNAEGVSPDAKLRQYHNAQLRGDRVAAAAIMSTIKGDDATKAIEDGKISEKNFRRDFEIAKSQGPPARRAFINRFLNLQDKMGATEEEWEDAQQNLKQGDIDNIDSTAIDPKTEAGKKVLDSLIKNLNPQLITQLLSRKPKEREPMLKHWEENIKTGAGGEGASMDEKLKWADENGYLPVVQWSTSTTANSAGISTLIPEVDQDALKKYKAKSKPDLEKKLKEEIEEKNQALNRLRPGGFPHVRAETERKRTQLLEEIQELTSRTDKTRTVDEEQTLKNTITNNRPAVDVAIQTQREAGQRIQTLKTELKRLETARNATVSAGQGFSSEAESFIQQIEQQITDYTEEIDNLVPEIKSFHKLEKELEILQIHKKAVAPITAFPKIENAMVPDLRRDIRAANKEITEVKKLETNRKDVQEFRQSQIELRDSVQKEIANTTSSLEELNRKAQTSSLSPTETSLRTEFQDSLKNLGERISVENDQIKDTEDNIRRLEGVIVDAKDDIEARRENIKPLEKDFQTEKNMTEQAKRVTQAGKRASKRR